MAVGPSVEGQSNCQTDRHPLLMEQSDIRNVHEHVIDIGIGGTATTVSLPRNGIELNGSNDLHHDNRPMAAPQAPIMQSSSSSLLITSNSRNVPYGGRRSPLNSGLWISFELAVNMSQIIAAIVVLSLSRHEHPQAPLFAWIVGYTAGCFATLPLLYWRYAHRDQGLEQDGQHLRPNSFGDNPPEPTSYSVVSVNQTLEEGRVQNTVPGSGLEQSLVNFSPRLNVFVNHFKMGLDFVVTVWFVVGNVWVFGGHSSASDAPNLYRLCIVFLTFSCIGYAMPFILCAMICCCLPCIISIIGFREDMGQNRGASSDSINALPTYKFKLKNSENGQGNDMNTDSQGEGGIFASGTEKERVISAEYAACCICLARYKDNADLRELPCMHFFHMECVDRWLKINALCPLCKYEVGNTTSTANSDPRHTDGRE